jgi:hypothetical protein
MDKEMEEAQKLTRDDLLAKLQKGRPANLRRRPRDVNQLASAIVRDATEPDDEFSLTLDFSQVTIEGMQFVSDVIEVGEVSEVTIRN